MGRRCVCVSASSLGPRAMASMWFILQKSPTTSAHRPRYTRIGQKAHELGALDILLPGWEF